MDTSLPQRFVEQSIHSLRQVRNQPFQLNQQTIQQDSLYENIPMTLQLKRTASPAHAKNAGNTHRRRGHFNHQNRRNKHRHNHRQSEAPTCGNKTETTATNALVHSSSTSPKTTRKTSSTRSKNPTSARNMCRAISRRLTCSRCPCDSQAFLNAGCKP